MRIVLVGPFDVAIVDVVRRDHAAGGLVGENQPGHPRRIGQIVALEQVVAHDQVVAALQDAGQAEPLEPVFADLRVISVDVEGHRAAVDRRLALIRRGELAAVDVQILAGAPGRRNPPVLGPVEIAVLDQKVRSVARQHHAAAEFAHLEFDILHGKQRQPREAVKIERVFEPGEGVDLRRVRAVKRLAQGQRGAAHVHLFHINLAPHAVARHQRSRLDLRGVAQPGQLVGVVRVVDTGAGGHVRGPVGGVERVELAIADRARDLEYVHVRHRRLHVDRPVELDTPPLHVEGVVVGVVHQRLEALLERQHLVAEGVDVARQIEIADQDQARRVGHRQGAVEAHFRLHGEARTDVEGAIGHHHGAPARGSVGGLEGCPVVGHAIADRAVVAHVDHVHHVAQEGRGDIFDHDVVDAHDAAGTAGQVEAEMAVGRLHAPDEVNARAVAGADDGAHLNDVAVDGERGRRAHLRQCGQVGAARVGGIGGDAHVGENSAHRFHPRADAQVDAGHQRRLPDPAQFLDRLGLEQFEAAAKILVGRHDRGIRRPLVGGRARRAVFARPRIQPVREGRGHEVEPLGNCDVHPNPFQVTNLQDPGPGGARAPRAQPPGRPRRTGAGRPRGVPGLLPAARKG